VEGSAKSNCDTYLYGRIDSGNVDQKALLDEVEKTVRGLPGVMDYRLLDDMFRKEVFDLETLAEENGAVGGLMPFVNRGVWETMKRKYCFIIVLSESMLLLGPTRDIVYISDCKGQKLGEYLPPGNRECMQERKDVTFLSDDFVLYLDVEPEGEPFFVLPEMPFNFLEDIPGITNVTSGSISTISDDLIRERLGHMNTKHWTHLVGFDIQDGTGTPVERSN
jgi:hypothetical protein